MSVVKKTYAKSRVITTKSDANSKFWKKLRFSAVPWRKRLQTLKFFGEGEECDATGTRGWWWWWWWITRQYVASSAYNLQQLFIPTHPKIYVLPFRHGRNSSCDFSENYKRWQHIKCSQVLFVWLMVFLMFQYMGTLFCSFSVQEDFNGVPASYWNLGIATGSASGRGDVIILKNPKKMTSQTIPGDEFEWDLLEQLNSGDFILKFDILTDALHLQGVVNKTKRTLRIVDSNRWNRSVVVIHGLKIKKKNKLLEVTFQFKKPILLRRCLFLAVWDAFIPKDFMMFFDSFCPDVSIATDHGKRWKIFVVVRLHSKLLVHTRPFQTFVWWSYVWETTEDNLRKKNIP